MRLYEIQVAELHDAGLNSIQIATRLALTQRRVESILDRQAEEAAPLPEYAPAPVLEPLRGDVQTEPAKVVRKVSTPRPRKTFQHGTAYGYKVHRKNGERACEPCAEANRASAREAWRRSQQKKKAGLGLPQRPRLSPEGERIAAGLPAAAPKEKVRVIYLAPPPEGHTYTEYAVLDVDDRTRPVSARAAEIEAASGATVLARTVTAWRQVQIPTIEGEAS